MPLDIKPASRSRKRAPDFEIYNDPTDPSSSDLPPAHSTRRASLKWRMIHEKENWFVFLFHLILCFTLSFFIIESGLSTLNGNVRCPLRKCFVTDLLSSEKRPAKKKRTAVEVPVLPLSDLTEAFGSTYVRFVDVPGESAFVAEGTASHPNESEMPTTTREPADPRSYVVSIYLFVNLKLLILID